MRKGLATLMLALGLALGGLASKYSSRPVSTQGVESSRQMTVSGYPSGLIRGRAFYSKNKNGSQCYEVCKVYPSPVGEGKVGEFPDLVASDREGDGLVDEIAFDDPKKFEPVYSPNGMATEGRRVIGPHGTVTRIERTNPGDYAKFRAVFDEADKNMKEFMAEKNR